MILFVTRGTRIAPGASYSGLLGGQGLAVMMLRVVLLRCLDCRVLMSVLLLMADLCLMPMS